MGLRYEITPPSWADKYIETIERGDVRGSSFIFRSVREEWDDSNAAMSIRTIYEAELFEVSPVTMPAYPQSSVGIRSAEEVFASRPQSEAEAREARQAEEERIMNEHEMRLKKLKL